MDTQGLSWDRQPYHGGYLEWIETESLEAAAAFQRQRERVLRDRGAGIALSDIESTGDGGARLTMAWALMPDRPQGALAWRAPSVELNADFGPGEY